jgi:uncharacterized protein (TIGR02301 family)
MRPKLARLTSVAALLTALPAAAATPVERQQTIDLAYVLGEAHALAAVCGAPSDLRWRARMNRLMEVEGQDPATRGRLADGFNAGFLTRQSEFAGCTPAARRAQRNVAGRGAALARALESSAK